MEELRLAIIADCNDSLANPKNNFSAESQKDECACYNNLNVLVRVLQEEKYKETKWVESWFSSMEQHMLHKRCKHVWEKKRSSDAAWDIAEKKRSR